MLPGPEAFPDPTTDQVVIIANERGVQTLFDLLPGVAEGDGILPKSAEQYERVSLQVESHGVAAARAGAEVLPQHPMLVVPRPSCVEQGRRRRVGACATEQGHEPDTASHRALDACRRPEVCAPGPACAVPFPCIAEGGTVRSGPAEQDSPADPVVESHGRAVPCARTSLRHLRPINAVPLPGIADWRAPVRSAEQHQALAYGVIRRGVPRPRNGHAMAFDAARNLTVLFGGMAGSPANDTWEWDGELWTQVANFGPAARGGHSVAYDVARKQSVLFGGEDGLNLFGDTWGWGGDAWAQLADTGAEYAVCPAAVSKGIAPYPGPGRRRLLRSRLADSNFAWLAADLSARLDLGVSVPGFPAMAGPQAPEANFRASDGLARGVLLLWELGRITSVDNHVVGRVTDTADRRARVKRKPPCRRHVAYSAEEAVLEEGNARSVIAPC